MVDEAQTFKTVLITATYLQVLLVKGVLNIDTSIISVT